MRRTTSVVTRLSRMEQQRTHRLTDWQIEVLAEEYGLAPVEIQRELEATIQYRHKYGPEPLSETIHRLAREFDLDESEIISEYEEIQGRLRERGVL